MSQARMEFVLKYVLEEGYKIDRNQESYVLSEANSAGRSDLKVTLTGDNLCIKNYDTMRHCGFFRQSKGDNFNMYAFRHQKIQMTRKDNVLHGGIAF